MNVIIYNNGNGVSVVFPTGELSVEEVKAKDCPEGAVVIDEASLPSRDFRNAWELVDGAVIVNFTKAQDLTKERLRAEREPLLTAQDVLVQKADETGEDKTAIYAEKQRLRDITNLVDGATELAQLRDLTCASTELAPVVLEPVVVETPTETPAEVPAETPVEGV